MKTSITYYHIKPILLPVGFNFNSTHGNRLKDLQKEKSDLNRLHILKTIETETYLSELAKINGLIQEYENYLDPIVMIEQIIIGPKELNTETSNLLNHIDALNGDIQIKQIHSSFSSKGQSKTVPYIKVYCNLKMTKKKGNQFKKTLKSILNVEKVDFVITEKIK